MTQPTPLSPPTLGVLQLTQRPVTIPGAMGDPASYAFPVRFQQVPEASPARVLGDGVGVAEGHIRVAQRFEREGIAAIISNCGFNARFQKQISAAVNVPVAMSSLQLVPFAVRLIPPGAKVGVITYDSSRLGEIHFNGAGWSLADTPAVVAGINGSESWHELGKQEPNVDGEQLARDVLAAIEGLRTDNPEIRALVLECSVFPVAGPAVRAATGLPTYDFVTLAHLVMASVARRTGIAQAAAE